MDFENMKDELIKHLSNHPWLTVKNLSKRLNEPRKKINFILNFYDEQFQQRFRNPINSIRKRPVWSLKKLTGSSSPKSI
jgi:hypothetical protein